MRENRAEKYPWYVDVPKGATVTIVSQGAVINQWKWSRRFRSAKKFVVQLHVWDRVVQKEACNG